MEKQKPVLVVMAAGLGSRFKGLKQITGVDDRNHSLMDYAIYDAMQSGFGEVVFIIRREFEKQFREAVGDRVAKKIKVTYAFQALDAVPDGTEVPAGREKPWGTTHAIWSAREALRGKRFLTVNSDDFYGRDAFRLAAEFFRENPDPDVHGCLGYSVVKTLDSAGTVSRGICKKDPAGYLERIDERKEIKLEDGRGYYTLDHGASFHLIPGDAVASMNMWAFQPGFIADVEKTFPERFRIGISENPLGFEETLSDAVQNMLERGTGRVKIVPVNADWFGMTYADDLKAVRKKLADLVAAGEYPEGEW